MSDLRVYVVETIATNGRWFVFRAEKYRDTAWEQMRQARQRWPGQKLRVRRYEPSIKQNQKP